ncbi:MFS transporter [Novosphingobium sp.]|uniref:MFS transporter n=1 Tax=Novosphingobium sp. TaxID=1874826 RepID=UPI00286E88ED|nr:MFS transporter [Novosphingobium sp.]
MKLRTQIGWGLGSFTTAALVGSVGLLHMRFMTDSLGMAIGVAGLLVVFSRVYDAVLDPLMGAFSDRTSTRWGRYRPYLVAGAVFAALALVLLFNVPAGLGMTGTIVFSGGALLLYSTAYTMFRIPYLALGRAITQDFHERSRLMTFSVYGSSLGSLTAMSAGPWLLASLGSDRTAHGLIAWIVAILVALGGTATFLLISAEEEGAQPTTRESHSWREAWRALAQNRPFQRLIGFKITMFAGLSVHGAALPYYTRHVLHASDTSLSGLYLFQTLATMASQFLWIRVARRFGRANGLIAAALLDAVAMLCWYLVPAGAPTPWVQMLGCFEGICIGGLIFGLYAILTDTMDLARRNSATGHEGVLSGLFVMVEKATAAFGAFIFSVIMSGVGFVSAKNAGAMQSPQVLAGIVIAMSLIPAAAAVVACLFLRGKALRGGPVAAAILVLVLAFPATPWAKEGDGIVITRVLSAPDGKSYAEPFTLPRPAGAGPKALLARLYTTDAEIGVSKPGTFIDWHPVSTPRLLVVLKGMIEIGTGDGKIHRLRAGDMALAMDTTGQGHTSRMVGKEPVMAMTVRLPKDDPLRTRSSSCPDGMVAKDCVANTLKIERK